MGANQEILCTDASFDVALCALGLMYVPDVGAAARELHRVLRPGGRVGIAVWGERARCGWASLFGIVDAEVSSEVRPLFFGLGQGDALAALCTRAGLHVTGLHRRSDMLDYANADDACDAAFAGGPVALAWSRFDIPCAHACVSGIWRASSPGGWARATASPPNF